MSRQHEFDDDDSQWGEPLNKQRSKRVKQRRRDTKRRYYDESPETEHYSRGDTYGENNWE
ncbi:small highly charged protein [Shewanella sp. YIC-542]|uniref:small highly charged protein n=1 Tax=Shewanella mytili TaxID=3377111 RepID=UPI00398F7C1B